MSWLRKLQAVSITAVFLALTVLAVAPQATAQLAQTTMVITEVGSPTTPIRPEVDNPQFTSAAAANSNLKVDFTFNCPTYVIITGSTSVILPIAPSPTAASYPGSGSFNIAVTRAAPGLQQLPCTVTATATSLNAQYPAASSAPTPFSVSADYYALVQATVNTLLKQAGPQKQVPFQVDLTNFGNARTKISFELISEPKSGRWQPLVPTQLYLESPNSGLTPTQNQATFTVSTTYKNGWNNIEGSFQVNMKSEAADVPEKPGDEQLMNFVVRVRGVYVPTLEPLLMLGALVGSAFVARLARKE